MTAAGDAYAGGTAQVETGDGQTAPTRSTIEFDGSRVRVATPGQGESYVLIRDTTAYLITQTAGVPVTLDLKSMMAAYGSRVRSLADGSNGVREFVSLTDTGRAERVAGIDGFVYELVYVDGERARRRVELVLSRDPQVVEFTRAFRGALATFQRASKIVSPPGTTKLEQVLDRQKVGVLRFADRFKVVALSRTTPAAARFDLPAEPMSLPDLGPLQQLLGKQPGAAK